MWVWTCSGDLFGLDLERGGEQEEVRTHGDSMQVMVAATSHHGVPISVLLRGRVGHMKTFLPVLAPATAHPDVLSPAQKLATTTSRETRVEVRDARRNGIREAPMGIGRGQI